MMEQAARRVKELVRLTDVLARYNLTPNRAGFLHCPFHNGDRDASLKIYPETDSWYCFGCGEGGDVIDFVAKMERCGFSEAIKQIETDFGLSTQEGKETYTKYRQRISERRRREKEKETLKDAINNKIAHRRSLWLALKSSEITNHEQAQKAALLMAEIERLDCEIQQMGGEGNWKRQA